MLTVTEIEEWDMTSEELRFKFAKNRFFEAPSAEHAANFLKAMRAAEEEGDLSDDEVQNCLASIEEWLESEASKRAVVRVLPQ